MKGKKISIVVKKTNTQFTLDQFVKRFCRSLNWEFIGDVYENITNPGEYIVTDAFGKYEFIDPTIFEVIISEDDYEN